jgi:undecaprenyl-diphosphatase
VLFVLSHVLGSLPVGIGIVLLAALAERTRGEVAGARTWIVLGLTTPLLFAGIKEIVGRPRPDLWPRLVEPGGWSFPSGHALASATFFPVLAWTLSRRFPGYAPVLWSLGLALPLVIGLGRLYLGVHWPTDVLAGWAMGSLQSVLAIAWLRRRGYSARARGGASSSQAEPSA